MIQGTHSSRQPTREIWTMDRLVHERAVALGNDIDKSTLKSYSSALNSFISFVKTHQLPMEPTPDTLSFYVVYMSHFINPRSVNTYLSGITQQLTPYLLDHTLLRSGLALSLLVFVIVTCSGTNILSFMYLFTSVVTY